MSGTIEKIPENGTTSEVMITLYLDAEIVAFFTEQSKDNGRNIQECITELLRMYVDIQHKKQSKLENIEEIKRQLSKGYG